jgi:hypothetical protein
MPSERELEESKQQLEEATSHFVEKATAVRNFAELIEADTYIIEIDKLTHRVENKGNQLQENFDKALPMTVRPIGSSNEEMESLFTQARDELEDILHNTILYALEHRRHALESFLNELINHISKLKLLAEQVKANEQIVKNIDTFQGYVSRNQRDLVAETKKLTLLVEEPGLNNDAARDEFKQILRKHISFHEKVLDELPRILDVLKPLVEMKSRRKRISYLIFVFLINILIYLQWSIPVGMVIPQWNGILAFIVTGLSLAYISLLITIKLISLYENHSSIFNFTNFHLFNKIIAFFSISFIIIFLILTIYVFSLHFLYLLLYFLFDFLTKTNTMLTFITNVSAIATIIVLLIGLLKALELLKYIKKLVSWIQWIEP